MEKSATHQVRRLDNKCKSNTVPLSKLPKDEHLHARIATLDPEALSDAELLSLLLAKRQKNGTALELGRQLIQKFGGLSELGGLSVQQLSNEYGMGTKNAVQLLAAFEFATRSAQEKMLRKPMNSADAIYKAMAPRLAHKNNEYVIIILLDTKLQAVRTVELSRGNCNTALCEPRDVLHEVIINSAPAFVLVHNHPSGDPAPSRQDVSLTKRVQQASEFMNIRFVDHLIIGRPSSDRHSGYYSFTASGVL